MRAATIVLIVVILIGLGVGGYMVLRNDSTDTENVPVTSTQQTADNEAVITAGGDEIEAVATIDYTDNGFGDREVTVPSGSVITVTNNSSDDLEFSSDPHPIHTDNPELNTVEIGPGERITVTVNRPGTWGFHNHLNESHSGVIVVQ